MNPSGREFTINRSQVEREGVLHLRMYIASLPIRTPEIRIHCTTVPTVPRVYDKIAAEQTPSRP